MSTTSPRPAAPATRKNGRISKPGAAFLLAGLLTVAIELISGLIQRRLGVTGHWAILICGGYFIIWGATEIAVGLFPRLGSGGLAKHRFFLPVEGRVFLVVMIALFVGSLLGRSNPLLLVFSCLAGPFVVNGFLIVAMLQKLAVARTVPDRVMAGAAFSVELRLENRKRIIPVWMMTVRDRVELRTEQFEPEVLFVHVTQRSEQTGIYRLCMASRGRVRFGPIVLQSRFPLGIVERGLQVDLPREVLVYPRLGRLSANWRRLTETTHDSTHSAAHVSQAAEAFHRLRDYHSGDDPRTIHWRTSARKNELIVREFRDERDSPLVLLIDAWQPANGASFDPEFLERVLSFVATVCVQQRHSARDAPVAVAAAGKEWVAWNGGFRGDPVEELLDSLATLEPWSQANWQDLVRFAAQASDRRQTTVLLSPRADLLSSDVDRLLEGEVSPNRSLGLPIRVIGPAEFDASRIFSVVARVGD